MSYLNRIKEYFRRHVDRDFAVILVVSFFLSGLNYWLLTKAAEQLALNPNTPTPLVIRVITSTFAPSSINRPTKTTKPPSTNSITPSSTQPWGLALDTYFATLPYPMMRYPVNWDISIDGLKYVEFWEGFSATKYDDGGQAGVGNCTIGYGHLLHLGPCNGSEGMTSISQYQAEQLLLQELRHCGAYVAKYVTVRVSQNQYNILSGLVCGVGYDRFKTYKFTALLNQGMYYEAAEQLRVTGTWGIGIGYCPGLVRRRKYEADRFTTNIPLWPIPPGY